MKVFHIRIDSNPGYNSDAIEKAFRHHGFEYYSADWQRLRYEFGVGPMRQMILRQAADIKPDMVFCHIQSSDTFDLDTWKELAALGFVINYTFDVRSKEKSKWLYEVAPIVGYTFFSNEDDMNHCLELGFENCDVLQSSCDMEVFKPNGKNLYAFDVVFCGNNYVGTNLEFPLAQERQDMIEFLQKNYGSKFMSYGLGQKGGHVIPAVEANIYNFSKISICQNNFERHSYSSDRLWRIMATGSMCLCKYFPGIEQMFQKEVHLDWFSNFEELKTLIDFYLSNEEERKAVAKAGSLFVRENHDWAARIGEMKKIIAKSGKVSTFE